MAITQEQIIAAIEKYCDTKLSSTALTVYLDGGFEDLIVKIYPIISITSIEDTDSASILASTEYKFNSEEGTIWKVSGDNWEYGRNKWKIIYNAGYSTIPPDIQYVIDKWLEFANSAAGTGTQSIRSGDYSESFFQTESGTNIPPQILFLLNKYKRMIF